MAEGREAEDQLHGAEHADGSVLRAVEMVAADIGADDEADGAMGIDVVGAILGVVFDDEDGGFFPDRAFADAFDEAAESEVVAGDACLGRGFVGRGALSVVLAKAHDDELRQRALGNEVVEFAQKYIDVLGVHYSATIDRWYKNWLANKDKVVAKYGEKLFRIWTYFLASSVIVSR